MVQEAYVLDGRIFPDFAREVGLYQSLYYSSHYVNYGSHYSKDFTDMPPIEISGVVEADARFGGSIAAIKRGSIDYLTETDTVFEFQRMGKALYPNALAYLKPLGIKVVHNVYDTRGSEAKLATRIGLAELTALLSAAPSIMPVFEAEVSPDTVGTDRLRIALSYTVLNAPDIPFFEDAGPSNCFDQPRNVQIAAKYFSVAAARIGLHSLAGLFPEAQFRQVLMGFEIPQTVVQLYEDAETFAGTLAAHNGICLEDAYDYPYHIALFNNAVAEHLLSLAPLIRGMQVNPTYVHWNDHADRHVYIPFSTVESLAEEVRNIDTSLLNPVLVGEYRDGEIYMSLNPEYNFQGVGDYSLGIIGSHDSLINLLDAMQKSHMS